MLSGSSVELIVYLISGSGQPCINKQHPTPAVYTLEQYMTMQVMNGICLSRCSEIVQISYQG